MGKQRQTTELLCFLGIHAGPSYKVVINDGLQREVGTVCGNCSEIGVDFANDR